MSRAATFAAVAIVIVVAIYSRRMAMQILGPGSQMWLMVADVQFGSINGEEWARQIYHAVVVWVPWLLIGGAIMGALYREFRRANITQVK